VDTNDSTTASSFNVFVPHQAPPNILSPFPPSPTAASENNQQITTSVLLVGIIDGIAAISSKKEIKIGYACIDDNKISS
jgi:hypothetical protein